MTHQIELTRFERKKKKHVNRGKYFIEREKKENAEFIMYLIDAFL